MILDTSIFLQAVLGGAVSANQPEYHVHFRDRNKKGEYAEPGLSRGALNSTSDVTILAAPGDNNPRREIEGISIYNKDTSAVSVIVKTDDATTERIITRQTLASLETLIWTKGQGWQVFGPATTAGPVLIQSITASAAATVDFTTGITDAYDTYMLTCSKVIPATDNTDLWLRASTNGGSSFLTTNSYIHSRTSVASDGTATGAGSSGAADQLVFRAGLGNASTEHFEAVAFLQNLADTAVNKGVHGHGQLLDSSTAHFYFTFGGNITTNSAVNAIRLMMSSGNINGKFSLYGLNKG